MLIGDNCLFVMFLSACRVVGSAEGLIWSRKVLAEGAWSGRGHGAGV